MIQTIQELVREAEDNYISGTTKIGKYVEYSMYEDIEKIEAYLNSKHVSGRTDALGREKPFFNIVTAATNIWYRATDIDRRNIRIKATKSSDVFGTFLATLHLQEWMRRERFGMFLNKWGRVLVEYGSAVSKFVEKGGELYPEVIPWNRLIVDPIDFDNNPKIERLWLTPAQLRARKAYNQEMVEDLIDTVKARETLDGQNIDNRSNYIEIYEVHGLLPLSMITGKEKDNKEYVQQMHVISYIGKKEGGFDDFTLYSGRESKDPYMISHLIPEDGQTLGNGAIKHLFEAQWMVNHTAKAIKDQLDLASKLIFQTADPAYTSRNALTEIETGDILVYQQNSPLTQINNGSHDISPLQNFGTQWQNLAKEITSTPDAISGATMPSGTAYRQTAILNQEAHSLFEIMIENKALHLEDMLRVYIIPFLKTKMNSTKEITATLEAQNIEYLDSIFIPAEAIKRYNEKIKKAILAGEDIEGITVENEQTQVKKELVVSGNQRFLKPSDLEDITWNDVFKDLEWDVDVEISNETTDKEATMTTLTTVLQTIVSNPQVMQTPEGKLIFNKILEETGKISPMELSGLSQTQNAPQATGMEKVGGNLTELNNIQNGQGTTGKV